MSPVSFRLVTAATTSVLLLTACGAWQAISDTSSSAWNSVFSDNIRVLNVDLTAVDALDPDEHGRVAPVTVRVYQLKDRKAFDDTSFPELLKSDRTLLAHDVLAGMASVLNPGASVSLSQPMQGDTKYVAVVAFYRTAGTSGTWKRVIDRKRLDAEKPLKLTLNEEAIELQDDASRTRRRPP
ncbi:MAG: type VI secretion system lipoprotein TssJ [Burkholderia sp.]|jgi:type VI secretion system protein VasD|uniref:type VI secretion system lipoprotein TssJ n=1 Tax=Burkholderia sp. TaxID=36773 RepID=UPI002836E97C|nr:type VI secretion system lipoprotein TssJ [Burkholderia sp.]MDR0243580.1 type VI secretion system lipoprotein TssJ [Burkholderia sp.]